MLKCAVQKLRLDQLVIQQGRQKQSKGKYHMIVYVGVGIAHLYFVLNLLAVNKEELMETITVGAEKIINTNDE